MKWKYVRNISSPESRNGAVLTILTHVNGLPDGLLLAGLLDEVAGVAVLAQGVGRVLAVVNVGVVFAHLVVGYEMEVFEIFEIFGRVLRGES